jgi:hypothetical protein
MRIMDRDHLYEILPNQLVANLELFLHPAFILL